MVFKVLLVLWTLVGASHLFYLRDTWIDGLKDDSISSVLMVLIVAIFISMTIAPIANLFMFVGRIKK